MHISWSPELKVSVIISLRILDSKSWLSCDFWWTEFAACKQAAPWVTNAGTRAPSGSSIANQEAKLSQHIIFLVCCPVLYKHLLSCRAYSVCVILINSKFLRLGGSQCLYYYKHITSKLAIKLVSSEDAAKIVALYISREMCFTCTVLLLQITKKQCILLMLYCALFDQRTDSTQLNPTPS